MYFYQKADIFFYFDICWISISNKKYGRNNVTFLKTYFDVGGVLYFQVSPAKNHESLIIDGRCSI